MSLLKRIESARPGAGRPPASPGRPAAPAAGGRRRRRRPAPAAPRPRLMTQAPVRESFRDVKFRIQNRVIQDLDPKLDLSNQVEVRRQIEEIFGKVIDEEGLALTRAERVRMLEQITDEIIGLGPLEPLLRDESDLGSHGQRPAPGLHRALRQARADERRLPERRPRHAHHRPDHRPDRPPRRRVVADGRRPPDRRLPRQRDHPAAVARRPGHHHPEVLGVAVHGRRPRSGSAPPPRRCSTSSARASRRA